MPLVKAFFIKDASLEFIPGISLKTDSNTEVFTYEFFMVTLFKLWGNFLRDIFAKHFLTKSQAFNLQVATLLEITCLRKYIELAFISKGYLYCAKNYIFIRMPMPMPMPMPRCRCRDFKMAIFKRCFEMIKSILILCFHYIGSLFGPFRNDPSYFAVQWKQKCCWIDPARFLFPFGAIG